MWEELVAVSQTVPGLRASGLSQVHQNQLQKEPPTASMGKGAHGDAWGVPSASPLWGICQANGHADLWERGREGKPLLLIGRPRELLGKA